MGIDSRIPATDQIMRWSFIISCVVCMQACTIKGYRGQKLPDDRISTVYRPADPVLSWFPLFWFPPFDRLLPEHWIASSKDAIQVDRYHLGTSDSILLLPGRHTASTKRTEEKDRRFLGTTRCDTPAEIIAMGKDGKTLECTRKTTCYDSFRFSRQDLECTMDFTTAPGHAYVIRVSPDERLILTDSESGRVEDTGDCYWSELYSETEEESRTETDDHCP